MTSPAFDPKNGNPTKPQVGPNQGTSSPARSPGKTKPVTPSGGSHADQISAGTPEFLTKAVPVSEVFDKDGYVGVDPVYQHEPLEEEEPEEP